jgi:amidophosphoribosyltransferase
MGGVFGIISAKDCVNDLFFGTDYHSHLGTKRGGLAVKNNERFIRFIHNIENAQFRSKFEAEIKMMSGNIGIGVISDYDDQPLLIRSHLGNYAIVTVGVIQNIDELVKKAFWEKRIHFRDMSGGEINPTELVATLINQESTFVDGIKSAQ